MGQLKNSIFYEIGAIDRSPDFGVGWRRKITPRLEEMGINVVDPTNKPSILNYSEDENWIEIKKQLRKEKRYDELGLMMHDVRNIDLRVVAQSTALVCNLDFTEFPCGTYEELFKSNLDKKPALIYFSQGIDSCPDWLFGVFYKDWKEFFYEDWDAMFDYLKYVDNGGKASDRWILFNF